MQMNASMQRKSTDIRDWPLVIWWIRATSPAPGSRASRRNSQWREEVTSLLFPVVIFLGLLPIPSALSNPPALMILLVGTCIHVGALFLKRAGKMYLAGALVTMVIEIGLFSTVLAKGRLDGVNLPLFDLLLQPAMISMAFFPPLVVFLIAIVNCLFILGTLEFFPHTAALNLYIVHNIDGTVINPMLLQLFVAGVSFIIIRALLKEIRRADNAEELAHLRQSEADLRKREAEQAQQLEEGIQLILQALNTAAARGDFSMRVPLAQENILWRVGYSINNLLARLQGFRQEKAELEKTRAVANQLTECIRQGQYYPLNQWTGTSLDQLIIELNKQLNVSPRPSDQLIPHTASQRYR